MFGFLKKKEQKIQPESKEIKLYSPAEGELIGIENVNDVVFAQKMMGDGFAILPTEGSIVAPVDGTVVNVFPTQHAIGFKAADLEVLLHMGIDTVTLNGEPFETMVTENQTITAGSVVSTVDLLSLTEQGKDNAMIVIFTNGMDVIESFKLSAHGHVTKGQEIGTIILK